MTEQAIAQIRSEFPALAPRTEGGNIIYLDNPGGTQVPRAVVEAIGDCLVNKNANLGGPFSTSLQAEKVVHGAHLAMQDFFNAKSPGEIIFGQNMTTLTLHMSRSIGRQLRQGDEIIVTRMDHDANVAPWLLLARDLGLTVHHLPFELESFEFDLAKLEALINDRTRLICFNHASNLTGTINDVKAVCALARAAGALSYIDSVQYAPHGAIDVQGLGCDFLVCSPYKFFGPHMGALWGREELLLELEPYKVRPAGDGLPDRFETGTLNHEGMAGVSATIDYLAWIGRDLADPIYRNRHDGLVGRRRDLVAAFAFLTDYELPLTQRLIDGLVRMPGVKVQGITNPNALHRRVPTVSFTVEGRHPRSLTEALAGQGIQVWDGHNYAVEATNSLGLTEHGGVVRIGLAHYNLASEVDTTLAALDAILSKTD